MKECWINVYYDYELGFAFPSRTWPEYYSKKIKTLYRIHVKLK